MISRKVAYGVAAALTLLAAASHTATAQPAAPANAAPAPADPARLDAARTAVAVIYSDEVNARMMGQSISAALDRAVDMMDQLPLRELLSGGIVSPRQAALIDQSGRAQIAAIFDPAHELRMKTMRNVLEPELTRVAAGSAPLIREGMALAYARRFSAGELAELNRFLATPGGKAFARNAMLVQLDPEVTSRMQTAMGDLRGGMTGAMPKLNQANAALPRPRKYAELNDAEKSRLAGLLGTTAALLDAQVKAHTPK